MKRSGRRACSAAAAGRRCGWRGMPRGQQAQRDSKLPLLEQHMLLRWHRLQQRKVVELPPAPGLVLLHILRQCCACC